MYFVDAHNTCTCTNVYNDSDWNCHTEAVLKEDPPDIFATKTGRNRPLITFFTKVKGLVKDYYFGNNFGITFSSFP